MSLLGRKKLDILEANFISELSGETAVTVNGNIQLNGNLTVLSAIEMSTFQPLTVNGCLSINSNIQCNGNLIVNGKAKVDTIEPLTINDTILIKGNINQQTGTLKLLGNSLISYDTSPPPSNYTTHYGPMIQGTQVIYALATSFSISTVTSGLRNGISMRYADISPLTISIRKRKPSSKIKITMSCHYEIPTQSWAVVVVQRLNSTNTFEANIDVPAFDGSTRNHGTFPCHYDANDDGTTPFTMTTMSFTILDPGATNSGVYTYRFRIYMNAVSTFYLNRTINDANTAGNERVASSTSILEEVE
jgi:hypothetical protein